MKVLWERQVRARDGNPIASSARPDKSLRILVVDNNRDCAVSLCFLCRLWGHDAECCFDSETAISQADSFQPNVFLLDIAMPRMNGYDLMKELQSRGQESGALFVAVSGYADEPHRALAAECGFDRYFVKPIELRQLQDLLAVQAAWSHDRKLSAINELVMV
jgi:CheY-like chemotaxis protein